MSGLKPPTYTKAKSRFNTSRYWGLAGFGFDFVE
jgi:hypothetical protein